MGKLRGRVALVAMLAMGWVLSAAAQTPIPMTQTDFHVPGTQVGNMPLANLRAASECANCHGNY